MDLFALLLQEADQLQTEAETAIQLAKDLCENADLIRGENRQKQAGNLLPETIGTDISEAFQHTANQTCSQYLQKHQSVGLRAEAAIAELPYPQVLKIKKTRLMKIPAASILDKTASKLHKMHMTAATTIQRWVKRVFWVKKMMAKIRIKVTSASRIQLWFRRKTTQQKAKISLRFRLFRLKSKAISGFSSNVTGRTNLRTAAMRQIERFSWFRAHLECQRPDFWALKPVHGIFHVGFAWRRWRSLARCLTIWKLSVVRE